MPQISDEDAREIQANVERAANANDRREGGDQAPSANSRQVGGSHYKDKRIEPWDFILANGMDFFQGEVIKHVSRWRDKAGLEDLLKARHYLDKYIEGVRDGLARANRQPAAPQHKEAQQ